MEKVIGTNIKCLTKTSDGTFTQIAFARSAQITIKRDLKEIASASTGIFKEYIPSRIGWSIAIDSLLSDRQELLYDLLYSGKTVLISWEAEKDGNMKFAYSGNAYIKSMVMTGNIHEMATFASEFQGSGKLSVVDY